MWYYRQLANGLIILNTRPEHAPQLEALQRVCFPTLDDAERFKAPHYLKHLELYPEGQFVALDNDTSPLRQAQCRPEPGRGATGLGAGRVVGATTTLRLHFDFDHVEHTFAGIIQGGWLTSHRPDGPWLYGADIGVHPEYRGRGLAMAMYAARQELVWRQGLRGQVTAGMMAGYGAVKGRTSAQDYYQGVVAGTINDPTLSMQLRAGFEPRALLSNYLNDPVCDNQSVLLVLDSAKDLPGASRDRGSISQGVREIERREGN